jgi:hypothetical protein
MTTPGHSATVTYSDVIARLAEQRLRYAEMNAGSNLRLVVTKFGGRIFAFPREGEDGLFWINPAFADSKQFAAFASRREWNIGGDRVWIGPEIQFITQAWAERPGEAPHRIPWQMDPGDFTLNALDGDERETPICRLEQKVDLKAHTVAEGLARIQLERVIQPASDPLAGAGLASGVFLGGYEQRIRMLALDSGTAPAEWWSVTNLHPAGDIYFAATPDVRVTDFIQSAPPELRLQGPGYVGGRITGDCGYKLGFSMPHLLGRYAYLAKHDDGTAHLFVRAFTSSPEGRYLEQAAHRPGYTGAAAFVYNDGGGLGGFGEFECMGAAIGGENQPRFCEDRLTLWVYAGTRTELAPVMRALLGIEI